MAYLLTTHRISNTMSAYQLLRNSLNFLGKDLIYMDVSMKLDICNCSSCIPFLFCAAASTDLTVNGISLAKNPDSAAVSGHSTCALEFIHKMLDLLDISLNGFSLQPSLAEFHSSFQVVFVDPSGHLNLCADMTACTYKQVNILNKISLSVMR